MIFNSQPISGSVQTLDYLIETEDPLNPLPFTFFEYTFTSAPTSGDAVLIGSTLNETVSNLKGYLNARYLRAFDITVSGSTITIEFASDWVYKGATWNNVSSSPVVDVTFNITGTPIDDPEWTAEIQAGSPACTKINVAFTVTGTVNLPLTYFVSGYATQTINSATHDFEIDRPTTKTAKLLRVTDANGDQIFPSSKTVQLPRKLSTSDLNLNVRTTSSGSTITVGVDYYNGAITPFTFSIDGSTYQSGGIFQVYNPDTYTIYVKDAFGCVVQKDVLVTGTPTESGELIGRISEINPIRFFKEESGEPKNYYNAESKDESVPYPKSYTQKWVNGDLIPLQVKTNAPYLRAYALGCNGGQDELYFSKEVENTNQVASTEATLFSNLGKASLYFGEVYELDVATGQQKELVDFAGFLPEWIKVGEEVFLGTAYGYALVTKTYYSDRWESIVAELDFIYFATPATVPCTAIYNIQEYDVYSLVVDTAAITDDYFKIVVGMGTSASDIQLSFISEPQRKVLDSVGLLKINYKHHQNVGDFIYQTGVTNFIRVHGWGTYKGEQIVEGYNGDEAYYKTNDEVYNTQEFIFTRLSSAIAHKMRLIIAHSIVSIDGLFCKLAEQPELQEMKGTNLSHLRAVMKVSGNEFNPEVDENFVDPDTGSFPAIEASEGSALILYTKDNG